MIICSVQGLTLKMFTPVSMSNNAINCVNSLAAYEGHTYQLLFHYPFKIILLTGIDILVFPTNFTGVDENIPTTNIYEKI